MNPRPLFVALLLAVGLVGCSSPPRANRLVQEVLSAMLPPSYTGDVSTTYRIPAYLSIRIEAGGVYKDENGFWNFTWAEYHRDGPGFSSVDVKLGKRP
jgi:hypothetical protein